MNSKKQSRLHVVVSPDLARQLGQFSPKDMSVVRTRMILRHRFFGSLAMRLKLIPDLTIRTACVDGTSMWYNPEFFGKLTMPQRLGVVVHEVMHCALQHLWRRNGRDMQEWNEACDYVINLLILRVPGLELPPGCLVDARFEAMTAEKVYAIRHQEKQKQKEQQQQQGQGQGKPDQSQSQGGQADQSQSGQPGQSGAGDGKTDGKPEKGTDGSGSSPDGTDGTERADARDLMGDCPTGGFVDGAEKSEPGPNGERGNATGDDWKIAVEQAILSNKKAGTLPGGWAELIEEARTPSMEPWVILEQFMERVLARDTSWSTPNRRMISQGWYIPGMQKENMGEIVFATDTSASTTKEMQEIFRGHVEGILATYMPIRLHQIMCDTRVTKVETLEAGDYDSLDFTAKGRGGTMFQPVFDKVEELGITPVCLIYLTDLLGPEPKDPDYPVLWAIPEHSYSKDAWFGTTIQIGTTE